MAVAHPWSSTKAEIAEELGEAALCLPGLVNRALEANERAKYLLSLLQTARAAADEPPEERPDLSEERHAAGVTDPALDDVVRQARTEGAGSYVIPLAGRVHKELLAAIEQMLEPVEVADPSATGPRQRLEALRGRAPSFEGDRVPGSYVDAVTSARREAGDSLHLIVMDLHRELNALQSEIAAEHLDGASVYGLGESDEALVAAFMAGVHETERLKFDHPGLATTATRVGERLVIQNDLGTTSAHVVVLSIEHGVATITYSDVHGRRLRYLESLLDEFDVTWSSARRRRGGGSLGAFQVTVGRYVASGDGALATFLRRLGSRLVFILDWNRARKRLDTLLPDADAVEALRWAADHDLGHIALLGLGGDRMIYDAVEAAAKVPARYGEPLVEVLGKEATVAIVRFALKASAEGMLSGKSSLLIRDELRVEVLRHVQASHRRLLDASAEHAGLVVECARGLRAALVRLAGEDGGAFVERASSRAARFEHAADEILLDQRQAARRVDGGGAVTALTTAADDALDALEEATFLLTLLPASAIGVVRPILGKVAAVADAAAREHLKAVEIAREVVGGSSPEDLEDFLVAVDRVASLEHDADTAYRAARAALVTRAPEFRSLYLADGVSRGAEEATDALMRSALGLRDHVLSTLSAR